MYLRCIWTCHSRRLARYSLGATIFICHSPGDTGWQVSLMEFTGGTVARDEGLELNVLGVDFGIDVGNRAQQLSGFGRLP